MKLAGNYNFCHAAAVEEVGSYMPESENAFATFLFSDVPVQSHSAGPGSGQSGPSGRLRPAGDRERAGAVGQVAD